MIWKTEFWKTGAIVHRLIRGKAFIAYSIYNLIMRDKFLMANNLEISKDQ